MSKTKCLVVLSGGQDSTTCLFWAKKYFEEVHAITFDYNQRHRREIQAALDVAKIAGIIHHEVVALGPILAGTSPLTNPDENLELYKDHDSMEKIIGNRVEKTFVPMRNALFLTLAANRAVVAGIQTLVTGVCQADNANYPDCRSEFVRAQERAIKTALDQPFTIHTPLMFLSKADSIRLALALEADAFPALGFSHTAYDGVYPPAGADHASTLRAHGFEQAGYPDPLVIRAVREGLMAVPGTRNYTDAESNAELADLVLNLSRQFNIGRAI